MISKRIRDREMILICLCFLSTWDCAYMHDFVLTFIFLFLHLHKIASFYLSKSHTSIPPYLNLGIPIEHFPATDTGNIKLIYFKQWINLRTHLEYEEEKKINNNDNNNNNNIIIVECPLSNDVIFRRGKTMNFHSGNIKFQNLIESRICEYFINPNTSLSRRKEIEIDILNEILNSCGRFLTWIAEKKWWLVIHSEDEMQFKIHYAFLGFRTRMLKKQQKQQKVVPTVAKLTSLFEGQQVGQKKKRYNNNNCSISSFSDCGLHCDSDDNNSNNSGNNNCSDCGYFFSVDDGSYACTDFS